MSTWKGRLTSKWQRPGISLNAWWNISCVRPKGLSVAVYSGCTVRMDSFNRFFHILFKLIIKGNWAVMPGSLCLCFGFCFVI